MNQKPIAVWTAQSAVSAERYAARELAKYVELAWGKEYLTGEVNGALVVRVGTAEHLNIKDNAPRDDGFVIRRDGGDIVIAGASPRGTIYGVYQFIERYMGVRYLTPTVEYIPAKAPLPLPEKIDIWEHPSFAFRGNEWHEVCYNGSDCEIADYAAKIANMDSMAMLDEEHGGNIVYPSSHSFERLCSPEVYFDEHPEYFSEINGVRVKERSQLCLTNPEVFNVVLENLKKTIRAEQAEHPDHTIFAVAQNDWYNYCQCEKCAAVDAEEGGHAGTLIRFVNAIAEAIEPEFPDVIIDTLAYNYTRKAPRFVKPRHNVVVRICTIESCLSHPLRECQKENDAYARRHLVHDDGIDLLNDDLKEWGKICTHYNCWTYVTNFAHYAAPVPNLWVLADNMRFFAENGVTDLRCQGNRESPSGEMGSLRGYLIAKLMWNTERDVDQILMEFAAGYYGMAAGPILAYLRMVNEKGKCCHAGLYDHPWEAPYLDEDYLEKAEKYFRQAKALADNDEILWRVNKAYLSVEYVRMTRNFVNQTRQEATVSMDAFIEKAMGFGITHIRELGGIRTPEESMRMGRDSILDSFYGKE